MIPRHFSFELNLLMEALVIFLCLELNKNKYSYQRKKGKIPPAPKHNTQQKYGENCLLLSPNEDYR